MQYILNIRQITSHARTRLGQPKRHRPDRASSEAACNLHSLRAALLPRKFRRSQTKVSNRLPAKLAVSAQVLALLKLLNCTASLGPPTPIGRSGLESVLIERLLNLSDLASGQAPKGNWLIACRVLGRLPGDVLLVLAFLRRVALHLRLSAALRLHLIRLGLLLCAARCLKHRRAEVLAKQPTSHPAG